MTDRAAAVERVTRFLDALDMTDPYLVDERGSICYARGGKDSLPLLASDLHLLLGGE